MKKTLRELAALFTFASMIGFIVFAILGLRSLEGEGDLDRRIVDCLQNILLCMFCLFNLLLPVVFNNIIPNQTSQKTA